MPVKNMKRYLDGILHFYDEGRTKISVPDLFGMVEEAEHKLDAKEANTKQKVYKYRGTLKYEYGNEKGRSYGPADMVKLRTPYVTDPIATDKERRITIYGKRFC